MALFYHRRSAFFWLAIAILKYFPTYGFQNVPLSKSGYQFKTRSITFAPQRPLERRALLRLSNKLWDRLEIEEDPEPFWYLLNCVAGLEIDLLRQCREACRDMPDAIKFVVPTKQITRSHGAKRMVTETKVKYQGYVFAKLRLCPEVYEAIQGLDLCRSWMGTVNRKGNRKLPPSPVALNELEVENFGLEELDMVEEEEVAKVFTMDGEERKELILDEAGSDKDENGVDEEAIKAFLGIQVEDMVEVTKPSQWYGEKAQVRRLKDGKILVRFYNSQGFENWFDPSDVRKLNEAEVLRGLSGSSEPITQRDFDRLINPKAENDRATGRRHEARSFGGSGTRNRRQDRVSRGQTNRRDSFVEDGRQAEKNWDWYKEQRKNKDNVFADDEWTYRPGSTQDTGLEDGDVPQWGKAQSKKERRNAGHRNKNDGDWSSFVSPSSVPAKSKEEDDFFSSLMSDLSQDLDSSDSKSSSNSAVGGTNPRSEEDSFFASLLDEGGEGFANADSRSSSDVDDFFSSLASSSGDQTAEDSFFDEDDLFGSFESNGGDKEGNDDIYSGLDFGVVSDDKPGKSLETSDDFFASLEQELGSALENDKKESGSIDDDFFAGLGEELGDSIESENVKTSSDDEDFFADLGNSVFAELDDTNEDGDFQDEPEKPTEARDGTAPAVAEDADRGDLSKLTVDKLKEMLRARGMKVSGKKAELIERLSE